VPADVGAASAIGASGPGRSADLAPLRHTPLYAQAEKVLEDLLVRGRYRVGDRIPPEIDLMASLGVSRATIRAAVGRLVDRGLLVRRQGSGTFLARLPEAGLPEAGLPEAGLSEAGLSEAGLSEAGLSEAGLSERSGQPVPVGIRLGSAVTQLGRLETYTSIAERLGLKTGVEHLVVDVALSTPDEAAALELAPGRSVTRVSRVLLIDGQAAAWMVDVCPADLVPAGIVRERLPSRPMLLDLLLDEGVPVAFSEVEVGTALLEPGQAAAAALGLNEQTAALMLTETMYLEAGPAQGRPVQWSRNYFLPGTFSLRLVRETPADRDPGRTGRCRGLRRLSSSG
jgi:GntR family transcriptional regulator